MALFFVLSTAENEMGEKVLAVCCVVIGVVAALLQGFAYFEVGAQAGWHMVPLPLSYLLTSLAAGAAIYLALAAVKGAEAEAQVLTGKIVMALAALGAVAAIAYVGNLAAAGLLEGGALTVGAVTVAVAVVAFALGAWFAFKSQTTGLAVGAAVLCVGASLAVRVLMWVVAEVDLNLIAERLPTGACSSSSSFRRFFECRSEGRVHTGSPGATGRVWVSASPAPFVRGALDLLRAHRKPCARGRSGCACGRRCERFARA